MSVGENIRSLREQKGFTQADIASQSGISQSMLCQIERGTKNPSLQVSIEIARAMQCSISDFLKDS